MKQTFTKSLGAFLKPIVRQPLFKEISYIDPSELFFYFANTPWNLFLDSANHSQPVQETNRYSYLAVDPFHTLTLKDTLLQPSGETVTQPFTYLKNIMAPFCMTRIAELPPFQGGMAGYLAYDICHYLEEIPFAKADDHAFPDLALGIYDLVYAFDHKRQKAWIISAGLPEQAEDRRLRRAQERIDQALDWLNAATTNKPQQHSHGSECAPLLSGNITSNFTPAGYINMVSKVKDYILAGDIFEANVSQRFTATLADPLDFQTLYQRFRQINPAPFAAFLQFDDIALLSASPERFILVNDRKVETRPIKGTAKRSHCPQEDAQQAKNLETSAKDRAENIMIVDLMRNDLSRVCMDHSITVETLCGLETFATVHHLVSVIKATILANMNAYDVLQACMPGGSITGAPKIRAMEIISELELNNRGPYCGCMGFIAFNGDMDTSIIIRTYVIRGNTLTFQTGGAIVLDSDPAAEYQETLDKAYALGKTLSAEIPS